MKLRFCKDGKIWNRLQGKTEVLGRVWGGIEQKQEIPENRKGASSSHVNDQQGPKCYHRAGVYLCTGGG